MSDPVRVPLTRAHLQAAALVLAGAVLVVGWSTVATALRGGHSHLLGGLHGDCGLCYEQITSSPGLQRWAALVTDPTLPSVQQARTEARAARAAQSEAAPVGS